MSDVRDALVSNPQQGQDASGRWLSAACLTDPFWLVFAFLYGLAFLALLLAVRDSTIGDLILDNSDGQISRNRQSRWAQDSDQAQSHI